MKMCRRGAADARQRFRHPITKWRGRARFLGALSQQSEKILLQQSKKFLLETGKLSG